jgi:hypothetical protein
MTTPINLTQLRTLRSTYDDHELVMIPRSTLLALIDTAEAAIALMDETKLMAGVEADYDRLRETLNHYTTTP